MSNGDAIAVGRTGTNRTGFDMAIARLRHQDGRSAWERVLEGQPGGLDTGVDVTVDGAGDVAVSGRLSSAVAIVKLHGGDGSDY